MEAGEGFPFSVRIWFPRSVATSNLPKETIAGVSASNHIGHHTSRVKSRSNSNASFGTIIHINQRVVGSGDGVDSKLSNSLGVVGLVLNEISHRQVRITDRLHLVTVMLAGKLVEFTVKSTEQVSHLARFELRRNVGESDNIGKEAARRNVVSFSIATRIFFRVVSDLHCGALFVFRFHLASIAKCFGYMAWEDIKQRYL